MAYPQIIQDFYSKLKLLIVINGSLNIKNMHNRLWNCDETGLLYAVKPNEVVTTRKKAFCVQKNLRR